MSESLQAMYFTTGIVIGLKARFHFKNYFSKVVCVLKNHFYPVQDAIFT